MVYLPRLGLKTFRQKFFASYFLLLVVFLAFIFPFVAKSVQHIVFRSMNSRADALIEKLVQAKDDLDLIEMIKKEKHFVFYRIGLLDDTMHLLYDTHTKRLRGPLFFPLEFSSHPEIQQAAKDGVGYAEEYSQVLNQKMIYLARRFDFHNKHYFLRLAFPYQQIQELRHNFEIGFVLFSSVVLILFSALSLLLIHKILGPIRTIISAIKPYKSKRFIPTIDLARPPHDEFQQLADTINSLSAEIRHQIETLTQERNEKEAILEALSEGVVAVDKAKTISYANSMALELLQLGPEAIGRPFPFEQFPHLSSHTITNATFEHTKDKKTIHLNVVTSPRKHDQGTILVLQDTSIQYKVLQMRKDFIANASHELKTPITIIRGFAETLEENPTLATEVVQAITHKIVSNCERMAKTVRNLLTLADIEQLPESRLKPCNLVDIAHDSCSRIQELYPHADIRIHYNESDSFELYGDSDLLEVALTNLLDNAAKYSSDCPSIMLRLAKEPGKIRVSVEDNGIGIQPHDLEQIFQRFYRAKTDHTKKCKGSGLGLSIVETIMEKHFGTVSVTSTYGKGSTFTLTLADDIEKRSKER